MTKVWCSWGSCEYCKRYGVNGYGICGSDQIELKDDNCITYGAHTDMSPEYREVFWKRLKSRKDKHECKQRSKKGKRYEMIGLVWFTENDDRWGTDDIWFTEQKSGLRCQGRDINEKRKETILELVNSVCPVEELPEATLDDI